MSNTLVHTLRLSAFALAATVFAAGSAMAQADQDTPMRLSGDIEMSAAFDPIEISIPELPSALAGIGGDGLTLGLRRDPSQADYSQQPVASALPWYERFTIAAAEPQILWNRSEDFEVTAGERWGVTLAYSQGVRDPQTFDLQDFSAGAFFELTERVRLGGELRFTSPEAEIFGEPTEERTPEVRFESAFKF